MTKKEFIDKLKNLYQKIKIFAKEKPSTFIAIVIAVIFALLFITYEALHMTSTPAFCGKCHVETESGAGAEYITWKKNIHSYAEVGCIDCHGKPGFFGYMRAKMGGIYDLYGEIFLSKEHKMNILNEGATNVEYASKLVPNDWCLICHSDDGNKRIRDNSAMSFFGVKMRMVDGVKNPQFRQSYGLPDIFNDPMPTINISHDNHVNNLGLSCISCHHGVAHGGEFSNMPKMETCFNCHDKDKEKNPESISPLNDDCAACHSMVVEQQEGTLLEAKDVETTPPSLMADAGVYGADGCANCHSDAFDKPAREVCGEMCHGEGIDYSDIFDEQRSEYDALKAPLDALNIRFYESENKMTKEQRDMFNEFKYYYTIISKDLSKGIHNYDLAMITFEKAFAAAGELADSLGIAPVEMETDEE